jgi:regulator of protease activity HflC (stomatin/prohibitin superfamily)
MQFVNLSDMPEEFQNMVKQQYVEATSNVTPYGVIYQEASQGLRNVFTQLGAAMSVLEKAQTIDDLNLSRIIMESVAEKMASTLKTLDSSIKRVSN